MASEMPTMMRVSDRQLGVAEVLVHAGEDRDEEQHHADEHDDGERADQDRVDHRRLDRAADAVLLLELRGQAVEDLVEDTAELAGADHAHVEPAEHLGVLLERVGQADAGLDVGAHLADDLGELLVRRLLLEDVQAAQHREAGVDHGRELAREDGEVLGLDAAADLDLAPALLDLVEVEHGEARAAQGGGDGGLALALDLPGGLSAARVERLVREVRHCLSHAPLAAGSTGAPVDDWRCYPVFIGPCRDSCSAQRPAAAAAGWPSSRSNSAGVLERFLASSRVMMPRRTRSASAASMVCMPNAVPVCMVE